METLALGGFTTAPLEACRGCNAESRMNGAVRHGIRECLVLDSGRPAVYRASGSTLRGACRLQCSQFKGDVLGQGDRFSSCRPALKARTSYSARFTSGTQTPRYHLNFLLSPLLDATFHCAACLRVCSVSGETNNPNGSVTALRFFYLFIFIYRVIFSVILLVHLIWVLKGLQGAAGTRGHLNGVSDCYRSRCWCAWGELFARFFEEPG